MKKDDFEPAKIIGGPGEKQKEQSTQTVPPNATEQGLSPTATGTKTEPSTQKDIQENSFDGILDRFTGKDKGTVAWTNPYDMFKNGVFNGLYKSTVDRVAKDIKGIVITTIFHAYLLIGYYLLAVFFDNDEGQAFSRNPYKETSINDLARRDDIPFTRQKLTDCIKAAAVDMELNKGGHHFEHLNYEHQLQIARVKKKEERRNSLRRPRRISSPPMNSRS